MNHIDLHAAPSNGKAKRLVVAMAGPVEHRDTVNADCARDRKRFGKDLAEKLGIEPSALPPDLDDQIMRAADEADNNDGIASADGNQGDKKRSQATELVRIASTAELFHAPDGDAFATITVDEHRETWAVRSKGFRRWIAHQFYRQHDKAAGGQAVQDAFGVIEAKAVYDGPEHPVFTRLARVDDDIYLDLADDEWGAVKVTPDGWDIVADPPAKFRRGRAMLPLPYPERGGVVDDLRRFINVTDDDWPLVVAWLLAALNPVGPFPILCLHAEQGSGKSTAVRALRSLVDPNMAPLRSEPKEPRDLLIQATHAWTIVLDNLSHIPPWLSDALCRLSTGGGFSTRQLFTDGDEVVFDAQRPVSVNGIEELGSRGDLLDRSLIVNLPRIPETGRRSEKDFWREFDQVRPRILGALLDAVVCGLTNLPTTSLATLPRMADFALWAVACEQGLACPQGRFEEAYSGNRASANDLALEASQVAAAVREFAGIDAWRGTATELLAELNGRVDDETRRRRERDKYWPKTPRSISNTVKRLAPNLRNAGVDVDFAREPGGNRSRTITIRLVGEFSVPYVPIVPPEQKTLRIRDALRTQRDASRPEWDERKSTNQLNGTQRDERDANSCLHSNGTKRDQVNSQLAQAADDDQGDDDREEIIL